MYFILLVSCPAVPSIRSDLDLMFSFIFILLFLMNKVDERLLISPYYDTFTIFLHERTNHQYCILCVYQQN